METKEGIVTTVLIMRVEVAKVAVNPRVKED